MIVIIPDTAPLIHFAAGGLLDLLPAMGKVVIPDVIALEATRLLTKDYAPEVDAWLKTGVAEIAETDWGPIFQLAIERGLKAPRNTGELAIILWLHEHLASDVREAFVIYEDKRVPGMMAGEPGLEDVALLTTRSFLVVAERRGMIPSAEAAWERIVTRVPTANPSLSRSMKP